MSTVYLKYFGLNEAPFAITPDPAFVYLSPAHRDALAHLLHGVGQGGSGGFVQLTGEVGTGKTTMCRCLLEQLPEKTQVALILNPLVTPHEMLATICEEFGIETRGISNSSKGLVDALNAYLLERHAQGWRIVVVIDEAQNLSPDALEQVRLLTNLETAKHKLLQMVLLGQPELRSLLQRQDLRQLAQRITARYHLTPLEPEETAAYVRHRMEVAGAPRSPFTRSALRALHQRSGGVPRLINIIADRALAGGYAREVPMIGARLIHAAADEVQPGERRVRARSTPWLIAAASLAALVMIAVVMFGRLPPVTGDGQVSAAANQAESPAPGSFAPAEPAPERSILSAAGTDPADSARAGGDAEQPANAGPTVSMDPEWLDRQHALAWLGLAKLWSEPSQSEAIRSACDGQSRTGFGCIRAMGNLARIRRLGLPVLLVLESSPARYLLLRGIGDEQVLVGAGDDVRSLPTRVIEEHWLGEFLLPWPQAPDWPREIQRGESGKAVDIVLELAAKADSPWTGGNRFDKQFESWLKDFQRRHGIEADGIVGPVTLLHLMAPTISSPRLSNPLELTAQES